MAPRKSCRQITGMAAEQQLWAQDCDASPVHHTAAVSPGRREGCRWELVGQTAGTPMPQRAAREAGSTKKTNHHSHEGAVYIVDGICMTHIHALHRQQREAGTLRETSRWVSMTDRWAISESLFSSLTAKADYAGSTAVYCVAQKKLKIFAPQLVWLYLRNIYLI